MPRGILLYLAVINAAAFLLTVSDKRRAKRRARRVPERTLFWTAALGGTPLTRITMLAIRHKTRKARFMVGLPLLLLLQIAAAYGIFFR